MDAQLARGEMADVYRAWDVASNRWVAVKVLRAGAADPRRFETVTDLIRLLQHRNIVPLLDAGHRGGIPYLVSELVEGPTLAERLAAGHLDPANLHRMGRDIARALAHIHAQGVVHLDVRPSNILLASDGRALLADVGVARLLTGPTRLARARTTIGAAYLAPELGATDGDEASGAADVYALGRVLIEAFLGGRPTAPHHEMLAASAVDDPPILEALAPPWPGLLPAMTSPNPAARPSAATIAGRLRQGPDDDPAMGRPWREPDDPAVGRPGGVPDADPVASTAEFEAWAAAHATQPHLDDLPRTPESNLSELRPKLWLLAATFVTLAGLLAWTIGFR